jgi:hypothetical protein
MGVISIPLRIESRPMRVLRWGHTKENRTREWSKKKSGNSGVYGGNKNANGNRSGRMKSGRLRSGNPSGNLPMTGCGDIKTKTGAGSRVRRLGGMGVTRKVASGGGDENR